MPILLGVTAALFLILAAVAGVIDQNTGQALACLIIAAIAGCSFVIALALDRCETALVKLLEVATSTLSPSTTSQASTYAPDRGRRL